MKTKFELGQHVAVNFGYPGAFGSSKIIAVISLVGQVRYNVQVNLSPPHQPEELTRLYNVEERFIVTRQEWLDWNQSRPSFGTEYFSEEMSVKKPL